jgi:uncharacterized protein (DUF1697 family)
LPVSVLRPVDSRYLEYDTIGMTRAIALLRGINVGGHNKLPMADLRAMFTGLGCAAVETYIQSGNVVFEASAANMRTLAQRATTQIEASLGLQVPVQIRTGKQLGAAVAVHPYADTPGEEKLRNIMFLADKPTTKQIKSFEPNCSYGEKFELIGREVHVYCPQGQARTKFTSVYVDRALETISTTRNMRTVNKLLEMIG